MKIQQKISKSVAAGLLIGALTLAGTVYAATPVLSVAATGSGDSVQVNVSGANPNSGVIFAYHKINVGLTLISLGSSDYYGSLNTELSSSENGIQAGDLVYVTVGSTQSASVAWPTTTNSGTLSLSQTAVNLSAGQSSTITAYNNSGNSNNLYLSNNSNPVVANIAINGSQITVYANTNGSTTATLCAGSSSACASVYITVGSNTAALSFSVNNLTVASGQSVPVSISGGTGIYSIINNSNPSIIQASLSGSIVTLTTSSISGSSSITVCSSDLSSCGIINAAAGSYSSSTISFSQTNPTVGLGQSQSITISGGSTNAYYISANTNTGVVQASVSGNNLSLLGIGYGISTLTICSTNGSCGTLTVTVSYVSSGGSLQLSQTTMSVLVGQAGSITVSGGTSPYSLTYNPGNIFQSSLNSNILTITGVAAGSSSINVCSAGGACVLLSVTVSGSGSTSAISFSQTNPTVGIGQSSSVTIYGGATASYYISSNSNPSAAIVSISGSVLTITGETTGSTSLLICGVNSTCNTLNVNVGASGGSLYFPSTTLTSATVGQYYSSQVQASGGNGSYTYSLINSTTLPSGMSVSSTGLVYGTPTAAGVQPFTLMITDTSGLSATGNFTITINSSTAPNSSYSNGELINESGTIYIVYRSTKVGFANAAAFTGLGFDFGNVVSVGSSGLLASNQVINTSVGAHPWGSWIINAGTVYFVHQSGLIPIPDWNTFVSNGGQGSIIVGAHSYDMSLPILANMSLSDSRLQ